MKFRALALLVGFGAMGVAPSAAAPRRTRLELEDFLPAELESRYRPSPCKIDTGSACRLWIAGEQEARYMVFQPTAKNRSLWDKIRASQVVPALLPESAAGAALAIEAVAKQRPDDPTEVRVTAGTLSGKVQWVVREDVLVSWLPEVASPGSFGTLSVTVLDTPPPAELTEILVRNQAPDVIDEDSNGFIWFSSWSSEIYRIDPATDIPQPMTGGTATGTPDGLFVDAQDRVWYGAYNQGYLGVLSPDLSAFNMPYPGSHPAIPCQAPDGNIWVTDHVANRITEFSPDDASFQRSVMMPVANAWVVQCKPDPTALWLTLYNVNSLGRLNLAGNTVDRYPIPCAPAFVALDARGVWASCWNNGNIVRLDYTGLGGSVYVIPGGSGAGGISIDPAGRIIFTQNALGRVAVLDADRQEMWTYQLPSRPTFKDGVLAARSGTIWAPSPSGNLVGKIVP